MALGRLGFYRELAHGDRTGASIVDVEQLAPDVKARVLDYLESAPALAVSQSPVHDYFTGDAIGPLSLRTDGAWVWPSDLPHYVRTHDSVLDPSFVESTRGRQRVDLSEAELIRAEGEFFESL